jgi:hypothetical protein
MSPDGSMESTAVNTPQEDAEASPWEQAQVAQALRKLEEPILVEWADGDPEVRSLFRHLLTTEPVQLVGGECYEADRRPVWRKYLTSIVCVFITTLTGESLLWSR